MEKSYVARHLRRCISYNDICKNSALRNELDRSELSLRAAGLVDEQDVFKDLFQVVNIGEKKAYTVKLFENDLILRLLSDNIKRAYNIKIKSREQIISTLISFLRESVPYHIHRFDIESFYENIDASLLFKQIKSEGFLSKKNIFLLEFFFKELVDREIIGLPRGHRISAILSEVAMQKLDKEITRADGVYLYERFVDDIILITDTSVQARDGRDLVSQLLPQKLKLHNSNVEKKYFGRVSKPGIKDPKENEFDYLGYNFLVSEVDNCLEDFLGVKRRFLRISISDSKIRKIKDKIIKSFASYMASNRSKKEYALLVKRIKFLSGNYCLYRDSSPIPIKSGIYYNYKFINQHNNLYDVDLFFKSLLFFSGSKLSRRIRSSIPIKNRRDLAHFGFEKGFKNRRFHKFNNDDFRNIKRPWL